MTRMLDDHVCPLVNVDGTPTDCKIIQWITQPFGGLGGALLEQVCLTCGATAQREEDQ